MPKLSVAAVKVRTVAAQRGFPLAEHGCALGYAGCEFSEKLHTLLVGSSAVLLVCALLFVLNWLLTGEFGA